MATQDPLQAIREKSAQSSAPPQPPVAAPQSQAAPASAQPADSNVPEDNGTSGKKISLQKSYSRLNESLSHMNDNLGIPRTFSVPFSESGTADHIESVGRASASAGGMGSNIILTHHHSGGRGWGTPDGASIGFPSSKLRDAIIPKGNEDAPKAIAAANHLVNEVELLLPNGKKNPAVLSAKSKLKIIGANSGAGMTAFDLTVSLLQLTAPIIQEAGKAHQTYKHGGIHPKVTAPLQEPEETEEEQHGR